jgi:hypothetical protein
MRFSVNARLVGALAILPLGLLGATASAQQVVVNDGCSDAGGGALDISSLVAKYDVATDSVVVTLTTCGPVGAKSKYRVRFDHYVNQEEYPEGSGTYEDATLSSGNPHCLSVSDDQMMWHGKGTGLGETVASGNTITYTIGRDEFSPAVTPGHYVRLWAETQDKKIADRVPNAGTSATDKCALPQRLTEVVQVPLIGTYALVGTQTADILRDPARLKESAMGNLVADALRFASPGVDIALTNSGGLRADLRCAPPVAGELPCEILWSELFSVLPFGNTTVIETVTGAQLAAALVNGLAPACNPLVSTGRFPQVSGLSVSFSCSGTTPVINTLSRTPDGISGTAIPIGPGDTVRLVTNDFMYFGGDGYLALMAGTDVRFTDVTMLEIVMDDVLANSPVSAFVEGRIVKMP